MRSTEVLLATISTLLVAPCESVVCAAPLRTEAYHIVLPRRAIGAGEHIELRLEPSAPAGLTVDYYVVLGTTARGLNPYRAPYVIQPNAPPATVGASFSGPDVRVGVSTQIELLPGSAPGAEDCLGPGQSFSTVYGTIVPEATQLDEYPGLLRSAEPEYPRSAFVRGIEDTIICSVLVCRSGRVLDAFARKRFRGADLQPIQEDPKLVEAAIATVKKYVFSPGVASGNAVAAWIDVPVNFWR